MHCDSQRTVVEPGEEGVVHSAGPLMFVHQLDTYADIMGAEEGEHTRCEPRVRAVVLGARSALLVDVAL
jgi:hypothetical protein